MIHDEILPTIGKLRALIFEEPVSGLNLTDDEHEMHDRAWRFLIAPHARDWFFNILVEWQRTRLIGYVDTTSSYDRYYATLRSERFRSSHARYTRVVRDVEADIITIPEVFRAICAVEEIDRRRAEAAHSVQSAGPSQHANVAARKHENQAYIDWFVRSARYRYDSYSYALEQLLIETPHEGARQVDQGLSLYAIFVERAERRDFCGLADFAGRQDNNSNWQGSAGEPIARNSRMTRQPFTPGPNYRK